MSWIGIIGKFLGNLVRRPNITIKNFGHDLRVNISSNPRIIKWILIAFVIIVVLLIFRSAPFIGTYKPKTNNVVINENNSGNVISVQKYTPENHVDMLINNAHIDVSRIPAGYFIALQRIKPVMDVMANQGLATVPWVRPDISVSNSFRAYMKQTNPKLYEKRIDCTHLYTDEQTNRVPIRCYSMEMVDEFDSFLVNKYITEKQWRYIYRLNKKVQPSNTYNIYMGD